jgi:HEAT repeat protein
MTIEEAARALQDGTDRSAQLQAAGALREWAEHDKSSVLAVLTEAIQHPDFKVRAQAVLLFGHLGEGYDLLVAHLEQDPSAHVRTLCVGMLSCSDYPPAVQAFIAALQDEDHKVVFAACMLLGRAGAGEAVAPLRQVLEHSSWNVRFNACEALYRLEAVDQQVVTILEALDREPQARSHDKWVLKFRKAYPAARDLTTNEFLALARQRLDSQPDTHER